MAEVMVGRSLYVVPEGKADSDRQARQDRMRVYMAWLMLPREQREPPTKTEMAEKVLGVTIQTVLSYERDPEFSAAMRERLGQAFRIERLPAVFESLYATATNPENPRQVQAARTLLDWFGSTVEKPSELAGLSDEELERLAAAD